VIPLWANPEFIRNCRAQLRPRRIMLIGILVAVLSFVAGYSTKQAYAGAPGWGETFLGIAMWVQMVVLVIGGGLACGLSISRERDQNTLDFQRVTQLTALELAIGKLFGAPILSYFTALCLMPAVLTGAVANGTSLSLIAGAYLLLLLGAIAFHALALVYSMGAPKGSPGVAGIVLVLAFLAGLAPSSTPRLFFDMGGLGPAAAVDFALHGTWRIGGTTAVQPGDFVSQPPWTDVFFGVPVHHLPVLVLLYASFVAWCLIPLVRNLKRDPAVLEIYSPAQSVGLLCYVNLIMVGFYLLSRPDYSREPPAGQTASTTFQFFLIVNLVLLMLLGLSLLRNREQSRRRAYQHARGFDWTEAGWPAGCILAGAATAAVMVIARFALVSGMDNNLDGKFAAFQAVMLLALIVRDLCYLQWMNLRRTRHPITLAVMLLGVYYTCVSLFDSFAGLGKRPGAFFEAIFLPWLLAGDRSADWNTNPGPWFVGLAVQIALAICFAALHYRAVTGLRPAVASPLPATVETA